MGSEHVVIILIIISLSLITIPTYAESNIVFVEVEADPKGPDAGNEWVKLFNPSDNPVDLSGWIIESTYGITNTYTLSESIGACDFIKIVFPNWFIDNARDSLILYDNEGKIVDETPILDPNIYFRSYWKIPKPTSECKQPVKQEPVYEEPEPVGIGFYENKAYEFSFNAPTTWKFQENLGEAQVMIFPPGFNPLLNIGSPKVLVIFENLAESEVPHLNGQEILEFHTDTIRNELGGKLINSDVKDTPWGWEISTEFIYLEDLGFGSSLQLHTEQRAFHFKDREYYTVAYFATDDYYDFYHPVFEDLVNSLVIKGVVVPEFEEIALIVLGSSIAFVIVFARKFTNFIWKSENS